MKIKSYSLYCAKSKLAKPIAGALNDVGQLVIDEEVYNTAKVFEKNQSFQ